MRRYLMTLALAGLFGSLQLSSDASACCHKRRCAQPCEVVQPCPPPPPCPPPCPPPSHCGGHKKFKLFGCFHKKQSCAPVAYAPTCAPAYAPAPVVWAAPQAQWAAPQAPSGQGW